MLLRQTILYLPAQIVGPLSQVAAAVVWTHWLAPGPYGVLTFLIASQDLVFFLCVSWWTQYTMRYLGGLADEARVRFVRSEAAVLVFTMVMQALATLLVFGILREPMKAGLVIAAIACVLTRSLLTHLGERARTQGRIGIYTFGQVGGVLAGFLIALLAMATLTATPEVVLWSYAFAQGVTVVGMWRALGLPGSAAMPDSAMVRSAFAFGGPLLLAGGLAWLGQNGIRVVVEQMAGAHALGLIAVGWGLGQRLAATLAMLVIAASFPLAVKSLHEGSRPEAYRRMSQSGLVLIGLVLPASIGLCLLAEPLSMLFIAEPFRATTIAILPYAAAAGAVRNIRMHVADPVFLLIERPRVNTAINVVESVAVLVACAVGLLGFGLVGAVAGCFVGSAIGALYGFVQAWRLGEFRLPTSETVRVVAASIAMAVALVAVPWTALDLRPLPHLVIETALGVAVYAVVLILIFPEVRRDVRTRLSQRAA
jgi:O-antigen/teichoic acid export membrane protein